MFILCPNFSISYWQNNQKILSAINMDVLMETILNWIHEFAYQISVMWRFSNICTVLFHWFVVLFFKCLHLCNLRHKTDTMFFCSFMFFYIVYIFRDSCLCWKKFLFCWKFFFVFIYIFKREGVSGHLFLKTFRYNFGWKCRLLERSGKY